MSIDPDGRLHEEFANWTTHGIGLVLSLGGAVLLVTLAILRGTVWHIASVSVYASCLIALYEIVSVFLYVAMGWLALIAIKPLLIMVPLGALVLLFAGGSFYSTGLIFFASRRIPYAHAVWHVFVMAGSVCHYMAVVFYVLPGAGT